jgi:hypothetical protein
MTRYADPQRCPDCGAVITVGAAACAACGLSLRGETARRLFTTLTEADGLLEALRRESSSGFETTSAGAPASSTTGEASSTTGGGSMPGPATAGLRPYPGTTSPAHVRPAARMSAVSVPKILLGLGAACLLVAGLVFLAVAWSVLGVGGRTAVLLGFTAVAGWLAMRMSRRGLRGASEALALVAYGLLAFDVVGAKKSGWFGSLSDAGLFVVLGCVLALAGVGGALAARRHERSLTSGEVVAAIGAALATIGVGSGELFPTAPSLVLGTLLAAGATAAAHRLTLRIATGCGVALTVLWWLALTMYGLGRVLDNDGGWGALWSHVDVWPLLVAAAMVASLAFVRRLGTPSRVGAGAVAHALVAVALLAPALNLSSPTVMTLVGLALLLATSAALWLMPRPWGLVNVLTQAGAALGMVAVVVALAALALGYVGEAIDPSWAGDIGDRFPGIGHDDVPAPWLLPLVVAGLVVAVVALLRALGALQGVRSVLGRMELAAALAVLTVAVTLMLYPVPVALVVVVLLLGAVGFVAAWLAEPGPETPQSGGFETPPFETPRPSAPQDKPPALRLLDRPGTELALVALFLGLAFVVSLRAQALSAVALLVAVGCFGVVHLRSGSSDVAVGAGLGSSVLLGAAVWMWGDLLDGETTWVVLGALGVLGALVLAAPYLPARWWRSPASEARLGLEVGAAVAAVPLGAYGVLEAPTSTEASWAAVYLTVAGVVVTGMSLLRADRRQVGWLGGALLAAASWVRLWDVGVRAPEAYTLPSAAALLVVGLVHLRRERTATTMTALTPGLTLATVPSLLWVLAEPTGPRALLLGLGCLVLVLAGTQLRWTSPLVVGACVGALLVVRLAAPYIGDAVPRWVLLGLAGALLVAVGATWERRIAEARQVMDYTRSLR